MNIKDLHIGQKACIKLPHGKLSFPMTITGIFSTLSDFEEGCVYLDFDGNESDVWEESINDIIVMEDQKPTEEDYIRELKEVNEEWAENMRLQKKNLIAKTRKLLEGWNSLAMFGLPTIDVDMICEELEK